MSREPAPRPAPRPTSSGHSAAAQGYLDRLPTFTTSKRDVERAAKLLAFGESLPEVRIEPFGERHLAMKVARKTFAYYLNDHHGDDRVAICCKSTLTRQGALVAAAAERYYVPPYLGVSGWVALRLDRPRVNWDEVFELLVAAYRLQAPRRLAAEMG